MEECCELGCINEVDLGECNFCGSKLCDECYEDFLGYCSECCASLRRQKTEEEDELWKGFWESRF